MTHPIIGLSGKKRAGKDTVAETLIAEYGFKRFAFADVMKRAMITLDPIVTPLPGNGVTLAAINAATYGLPRLTDVITVYGWERAKEIPEVRRLLQVFGTEVGREMFGQDFWVAQTMQRVLRHDGPVVITDVRFPNELDAVTLAPGGLVVRINRPGMTHVDTHPSETALDDISFVETITNDGTLEELAEKTRKLYLSTF